MHSHTSLWHAFILFYGMLLNGGMTADLESFLFYSATLLSSDLASCRSNGIIKNNKRSSCFAVMEF